MVSQIIFGMLVTLAAMALLFGDGLFAVLPQKVRMAMFRTSILSKELGENLDQRKTPVKHSGHMAPAKGHA